MVQLTLFYFTVCKPKEDFINIHYAVFKECAKLGAVVNQNLSYSVNTLPQNVRSQKRQKLVKVLFKNIKAWDQRSPVCQKARFWVFPLKISNFAALFLKSKKGLICQSKSSFSLTISKSEFGDNQAGQENFDHNSTIMNCEYLGKCFFCDFLTSRDQFCAWQPTVCWLTFIASFPWLVVTISVVY